MKSNLVGKIFLISALSIFGFGYTHSAWAQEDPTCPGTTEQTCPDSDAGCHKQNEHYFCVWHPDPINHCNCHIIFEGPY